MSGEGATLGPPPSYGARVTSPDPTLPVEGTPTRSRLVQEVLGLLLIVLGLLALVVIAYDVDARLAAACGALFVVFIGWRLTVAEE